MCLAVPGRIVDVRDEQGTRMATIDVDGVRKEICLAYLPDAEVGDYAIIHVGFAISRVDEAAALETLALFRELGLLDEDDESHDVEAHDDGAHDDEDSR